MILKLKDGDVVIELYNDIAPKHVERFKLLANEKKYDGVIFHRVIIDGRDLPSPHTIYLPIEPVLDGWEIRKEALPPTILPMPSDDVLQRL